MQGECFKSLAQLSADLGNSRSYTCKLLRQLEAAQIIRRETYAQGRSPRLQS